MVMSRVPDRSSLRSLPIGALEVLRLAECLGIAFPRELPILAMKEEHRYHIREEKHASLEKALPLCLGGGRQILRV
jgi:hypothetical protein